ncbi:MAG: hypothetical protein E6I75_05380, partial [Chloroflexi bacterium]
MCCSWEVACHERDGAIRREHPMAVMTPTATPGTYIGASIRRREDPRLMTGRATYVNDIVATGCARVVFVRSPHAHARIRRIDISAAQGAA